jgi:hypothetical protein
MCPLLPDVIYVSCKPIVNVAAFSQQYNGFIYKAFFVIVQEMSVLSSTELHGRKEKTLS